MADPQKRSYTLYIDNTESEKALKRFQKTAAALEKEVADIEKRGGDATKQLQQLANVRTQINALTASIKGGLSKSFRDLQNDVKRWENAIRRASDPAIIRDMNVQLDVAKRNLLLYEANVLKVARAQKQLAAENGGFFTRMFGSAKDAFVGAFGGNLLAQGVTRLMEGLKAAGADAIRLGREAIGVRGAFNRLNDAKLLDQLRTATRGTVSDLELMKQAVNARNFQIPLENLGTLLEFAQRRAKETGASVDYLVNSIITGIARKSSPILDNLGISASRIASEFAKTGDYAKAVTSIVQDELGKMGQSFDSIDTKLDRQAARWENLKEKVGSWALSVVDALSNTAELGFGDEATKRRVVEERILQEIMDAKEKYREEELLALKVFDAHYIKQTKEGQERLKATAQTALDEMLAQEKTAYDRGGAELQGRLAARIEIWRNFLKEIETRGTQQTTQTTLGELKNQLAILQAQMDTLPVGSKELANTVKEIERVQKQIAAATGQESPEQKKAQSKLERDAERLADFLKKNAQEIAAFNMDVYQKEIAAVQFKYAEFEKIAKKGSETEILLAQQKAAEIAQINKRAADEVAKTFREQQQQIFVLRQQAAEADRKERLDILKNARDSARALSQQMEKSVQGLDTAALINADLKVRKAGLFDRLKAEKEYLAEQQRQEQAGLQGSLEAGEMMYAEFQAKRAESDQNFREASYQAEIQFYARIIDGISGFVSVAVNLFDSMAQQRKAIEDADLERERRNNEQRKRSLKAELDGKLLSREQYDQRVADLDRSLEAKEKAFRLRQFKREKASNIVKAIMGTAQAVVQALTAGPIIGPILAAITGAMGAAQIGIISAQQPPEYGQGGKVKGPSHDSTHKGLPVTDPRTGQVQAYLEGDEGILKKSAMRSGEVYTVTGTPSGITSKLNSMYGGTAWDSNARLVPAFRNYQPKSVDYSSLGESIGRVRMFENGGVFPSDKTAAAPSSAPPVVTADPEMKALLQETIRTLAAVQSTLAAGIKAKVYLNELNNQQTRLDDLMDNATFRA